MKVVNLIEVVGYAFGGTIAASRGQYVDAAKCFILAASSLVDPEESQAFLTQAAVDRENLAADVLEITKFGALS